MKCTCSLPRSGTRSMAAGPSLQTALLRGQRVSMPRPVDARLGRPLLGARPSRCLSVSVGAKGGKGRKNKDDSVYSATVRLPETEFNMRANSLKREPEIQKFWEEARVYETLASSNAGDTFTLHDGPPYANGDLHIGHALNKILKDFVNRYQLLRGRKAKFVPGWDTHGLPIELKVLQSLKKSEREALTPVTLREKAREFALATVESQKEQFRRYGVWADWDAPYVTLDPAYEAAQIEVFGKMVLNGHIYRGFKPVHWSPSSRTALAEAELEYPEGHTSRSIYVALPLSEVPEGAPEELAACVGDTSIAVWTTTPWTIPANLGVAVNERIEYAVCAAEGEGAAGWARKRVIVAKDLVETAAEKFGVGLTVQHVFTGAQLAGCKYKHPLYERESPVVVGGEYITTDSGTGLVHTAPGHGQEDYMTGQKHNLGLLSPVDDAGRFTEEAGEAFKGLSVQGEGNAAVIEALQGGGALLVEEEYAHKYPYDWRTKKPTIFRATEQWFASVEGFREECLKAIGEVSWVPAAGEKRISAMTEGRSDWCISRQRKWGVPIPVFYYEDSGEPLMTEETIAHVRDVFAEHGSDAWYKFDTADLLPEPLRAEAPKLKRGEDTMDVWFDSGSSWAGVVSRTEGLRLPADLYLEGSDQHRGWFQSSLLTSVAATGAAPYKQVLTHGFVLDEKGMKMSKSVGNVVDPRTVIEGGKNQKEEPPYGADVLRLWVASVDYTGDVLVGPGILKQVSDVYRKVRFTLRFLLGNLADFDPQNDAVPLADLPSVDRYILSRTAAFCDEVEAAYGAYSFARVYQAVQRFCITDLSSFYLDVVKDRTYIRAPTSTARRTAQTTLNIVLRALMSAVAPLVPHMAEDAWQNLPYAPSASSVFQAGWLSVPDDARGLLSEEDAAAWAGLLEVRDAVNKLLETARVDKFVGSSTDAAVFVHVADGAVADSMAALLSESNEVDELRYYLLASRATLCGEDDARACQYCEEVDIEGVGKVVVGVAKAEGTSCNRCRTFSPLVGDSAKHPLLCERCLPVVEELGFEAPAPVTTAAST